jgi:predicted PurR-regulated permease PerM
MTPAAEREIGERNAPVQEAEAPIETRVAGLQGYGFVSLAVIMSVAALSLAQGFFIPVVVAIVVSLGLARIVRRLERFVPRWIAAAFVVLVLIAGVGGLAYGLSNQAARAVAELPGAMPKPCCTSWKPNAPQTKRSATT